MYICTYARNLRVLHRFVLQFSHNVEYSLSHWGIAPEWPSRHHPRANQEVQTSQIHPKNLNDIHDLVIVVMLPNWWYCGNN